MKKLMIIAVAAMVAGIASADLSVSWKSQVGAVSATSGGTDFLVGSTIQLIWSTSGAITTAGSYDLAAAEAANDFYVLAENVTGANSLWNLGLPLFTSADVGGNNINSGFFYTRFFQTDGTVDGEYFRDFAMGAGADYVYNALDGATTYSADVVPGGLNWIGANGTTVSVIPEPATIGLFGLGALSAWIIRRNKAKREEA